MEKELLNLSDPTTKRRLISCIAPLQGICEVTIKHVRETRRTRANRYYFGCVVKPLQDFLRAQGQPMSKLMCHAMLSLRCNPHDVVDANGVVIGTVPGETHTMTIPQFAEYVDLCIAYLRDTFGIICEGPEGYLPATSAA